MSSLLYLCAVPESMAPAHELCGVGPNRVTSFSMIQLAFDSGNAAALVLACSVFFTSTANISWRGRSSSAKARLTARGQAGARRTPSGTASATRIAWLNINLDD